VTDKQRATLVRSAVADLRKTREGYVTHPDGPNWRRAMGKLERLHDDLAPKPSATLALGPVWNGGKSVLLHDLTHATSGIPLYPAFDDAFQQGRDIVAPEDLEVTRASSSRPGDAFYATGASKLRWWFGHLAVAPTVGRRFKRGDVVGKVAPNTIGGGPHVHVGINVELLLGNGKELEHHTNYTHGAPTVGAQLAKALEA
jgi:hypothetical protein